MARRNLSLSASPAKPAAAQLSLWEGTADAGVENQEFLTTQLITYLGNKRSLLNFIGSAVVTVQKRLAKRKLRVLDAFSGSGVVARYLKRSASLIHTVDLEPYSAVVNRCYLANRSRLDLPALQRLHSELIRQLNNQPLVKGFITKLYSPEDDRNIKPDERVFYTSRNARYLDTARQLIDRLAPEQQPFFLAPLLTEASIHANTSGIFKGFHKDSASGIGQFGGSNQDALTRILGNIQLPFPVFSNFECDSQVYTGDINELIRSIPEVDLAYFDPPYNQHPYGSNYFMLNLLVDYQEPSDLSPVSGIPAQWNRSRYNNREQSITAFEELVARTKARFILISFNSEGFITNDDMVSLLNRYGSVDCFETNYNTFRGCRNLSNRTIHVKEHLYLLAKRRP